MHLLCPAYSYADMCVPTFGKYISYSRPINSYKEYPYTTWLYFLLGLRLNGIGQRTYNLLHLGFSVTTKLLMWLEDTFEIGDPIHTSSFGSYMAHFMLVPLPC